MTSKKRQLACNNTCFTTIEITPVNDCFLFSFHRTIEIIEQTSLQNILFNFLL